MIANEELMKTNAGATTEVVVPIKPSSGKGWDDVTPANPSTEEQSAMVDSVLRTDPVLTMAAFRTYSVAAAMAWQQ